MTKKRDDFPVFELREYLGRKVKTLHRNRLKKVNELEPPEPPKLDKQPPVRQKMKKTDVPSNVVESSSDSDGGFARVVHTGVVDDMPDVVSEEGEEVEVSEASDDGDVEESDSSENTSDADMRSPRPVRNRHKTKAFMYDELGGNPVYR